MSTDWPETQADGGELSAVCWECRNTFGEHRTGDGACPLPRYRGVLHAGWADTKFAQIADWELELLHSAPEKPGRHRLLNSRDGVRWSQPESGVVYIGCMGDVMRVDGSLVGSTNRAVDTGRVWTGGE